MSIYTIKLVVIGIISLALVGIGFYFANRLNQSTEYSYSMSSQTVIRELRALNRLETASFTIEKVIDAGTSGNAFQEFLYGDRILLIAHGQVIAGIDLSKLSNEAIVVSDKAVTLKLPAPQILIVTLDNGKTRVYDRRQGLLARGNKDLESNARKVATEAIQDAACKGGILQQASENAKKQMSAFLKTLGFSNVSVEITQGSC